MKKKLLILPLLLALGAAPALALASQPDGVPPTNPGTQRTTPTKPTTTRGPSTHSSPSNRAIGLACAKLDASKSNENDPQAGTPFSRCVRGLAQAIRTACQGKSKSNENDLAPGTEYSRCVRDLARSLGASNESSSTITTARKACKKGDFDTGRQFGRCLRTLSSELRQQRQS